MLAGEISLVSIGGQTMGDCGESPGEKSSKVKLARGSGVGSVYGVESACRICEAIRDLLTKQKEVSPSRRLLGPGQRERPKGFPRYCSPAAGRGKELEGKEARKRHPPT